MEDNDWLVLDKARGRADILAAKSTEFDRLSCRGRHLSDRKISGFLKGRSVLDGESAIQRLVKQLKGGEDEIF